MTEANPIYVEARELHPRLPLKVEVIDCTLRDGEQAPGVAFTVPEKVNLARQLWGAGVSVLDAGFPAASGSDLEAMQAIRDLGLGVRVAATARPLPFDVKAAARARADEVFLFMPTSDRRLSQTLGLSRRAMEIRLLGGVEDAAGLGLGVSVVFEDATRADPTWMCALAAGIAKRFPLRRLVLADTVGRLWPARIARLFQQMGAHLGPVPALCAHCHNDFGLATANTLAAVEGGAAAVTCTVNGIGERAGNADLAETVAALTHLYGVEHGVDPTRLADLSAEVERMSGIHMSALKAVTGFNVFRHESGVHVDGMIKDSSSYEFLPSAWAGRRTEYVLGKHSGVATVRALCDARDDNLARSLLAEAKRIAETRDKTAHEEAYRAHVASQARLLSGVTRDEVLRRCADGGLPRSE